MKIYQKLTQALNIIVQYLKHKYATNRIMQGVSPLKPVHVTTKYLKH